MKIDKNIVSNILTVAGLSLGGLLNVTLVTLSSALLVVLPILYDYGMSRLPFWLSITNYTFSFHLLTFFSFLIWVWFLVRGIKKRGLTTLETDKKIIDNTHILD